MSIRLVSRATVYDQYAISRKFTTQETAIRVNQGNISLLASETELVELKNGNKTMYSKMGVIEVKINKIDLAVSSSEYKDINGVLTAVTQARASITINSEQILQKVSKDSVISSINQTAESVKIDANKIALTGNGIIDILNSGTTTISAKRINLNGVVTANQNFKILADGSMVAKNGSFNGTVNATDGTFRGAVYASSGSFSGTINATSGTFRGAVYASSGSFTGSITSTNATIAGTFRSTNGDKWVRVSNANITGGVGDSAYGIIDFGRTYATSDTHCLRLRGYPHINLMGQIYTSVTPGSDTVYKTQTKTVKVVSNIEDLGGGRIKWYYTNLIFRNGLMTG